MISDESNKKIITFVPIEIVVLLLIIAIPAIGLTVLSNKVSKNFTKTTQSSPSSTPVANPTASTSFTPSPEILGLKLYSPLPSPTYTSEANTIENPVTYRILTLTELVNMNGANSEAIIAAQSAYNIFLQTPNLIYLTPVEQINLFKPILEAEIKKSLDKRKQELQSQIEWYEQNTPPSQPFQYYDNTPSNSAYQECVDEKVVVINNNPYLSESSRLAQIEKAKQDCANQN